MKRYEYITPESLSNPKKKTHFRMVYCTRQYLDYVGLGDVLFLSIEIPESTDVVESTQAFVAEYTLAGVSSDMADIFLTRFLEALQWR